MSMDFEQTKREFSGRSILVTSWYDEQKLNWRASAPGYSHVQTLFSADQEMCSSRKEAIDQVVGLLTTHFAEERAVSHESIFFL